MASTPGLESQSLTEINEYHEDAVNALAFYLQAQFVKSNPRFQYFSKPQFNDFLTKRIVEADIQSSFAILAAVEAALRTDYLARVQQRRKDPLSRDLRVIHKRRSARVRLDEDLLDLWIKHHPKLKNLISRLRAALHFRHWLAHGRYWRRPAHGQHDYLSLYVLAELVLAQFPLYRT